MSDLAKKALELAGKASIGPWTAYTHDDDPIIPEDRAHILLWTATPARGVDYTVIATSEPDDARLIAFSREALPALAEEVMRLREALEATRRYIVNSHPSDHDMDAVNELSGIVHAALASKPEKE